MKEDPFLVHRSLLFTVAYEMLGSAADADDVVQDTWLRWAGVNQEEIAFPRAYLVRIVTRQALNRLRTVSRRREEYIGPWLPEPLLTRPEVTDDAKLAESVSIALLTVLETLRPTERAVFVLREAFDTPYDEIADVVGASPVAVRQIAHRARKHVAARRPRVQVNRAEQMAVVEKFMTALSAGDREGLLAILTPDVVAIADGGGVAPALRHPVTGIEKLAALLAGIAEARSFTATTIWLNAMPGLRLDYQGGFSAMGMVVEDGRISRIYAINNPHKLSRLETVVDLRR